MCHVIVLQRLEILRQSLLQYLTDTHPTISDWRHSNAGRQSFAFFTSFGSSFMYHYHPCLVLDFHNSNEISIYTLDRRMVIKASCCGVSTEISTIYHHFKINKAVYMLKRVSHNALFWSPTPPCWIFEHQHFISIWETDIIIVRFDKTQPNQGHAKQIILY